ncbi:MoaD/ThiS family protein [Asinibacterium sp. OR53]|uniref:MoaD/ThiS family protein n=1 Tax=Asinibacterium sp. OR53 TaxID=925409 RepID=UPI000479A4B7|nr:MoaD/ThiS family protein [Asinibacterium sp. OR53]
MKTKVLLFGQLAEAAASEMEISDVKDTDQLVQEINKRFPVLSGMHYRIAVNKNLITENTTLTNTATVALLPAFSGG